MTIAKLKAMQERRTRVTAKSRCGMQVKVLKAPKETKYLEDKIGTFVYKHDLATVCIDGRYTHFKYSDIEPMGGKDEN